MRGCGVDEQALELSVARGAREGEAHIGLVVRAAHERFDGSGSPDALAGGEIPLAARIMIVFERDDHHAALIEIVSEPDWRLTL